MAKTYHRTGFVAQRFETPPGDWCNGKHGAAKNRRGMKKFNNSRNRFHAKMAIATKDHEDLELKRTDKPERFLINHKKRVIAGEHNGKGNGPNSHDTLLAQGYVQVGKSVYKKSH